MEHRSPVFSRAREHIRSNVVGYLALFLALTGISYAAGLPKNSVKSKQIKDAQVKTQDLAANAVTSDKVAANGLTGSDIDEVSLQGLVSDADPRLSDARPPSGPAGGELGGAYPNPTLGNAVVDHAAVADWPNAKASQTSVQNYSTGASGDVELDTLDFGSGVTFDDANDRLVIVTPGRYLVTGEISWTANANGFRSLVVNLNATNVAADEITALGGGAETLLSATALVRMNAGDVVTMVAFQNSGGILATTTDAGVPPASLAVSWLGP